MSPLWTYGVEVSLGQQNGAALVMFQVRASHQRDSRRRRSAFLPVLPSRSGALICALVDIEAVAAP